MTVKELIKELETKAKDLNDEIFIVDNKNENTSCITDVYTEEGTDGIIIEYLY